MRRRIKRRHKQEVRWTVKICHSFVSQLTQPQTLATGDMLCMEEMYVLDVFDSIKSLNDKGYEIYTQPSVGRKHIHGHFQRSMVTLKICSSTVAL